MAKFMYLYKGPASDMSGMSDEDVKVMIDQWGAWMGRVGKALLDVGSPMANSASIVDDGSAGEPALLSGYSIVEAADLEEAKALADGHPFLSAGTGEFSVDIFELFPAPF
jgi:hypothetical protein